MIKKIENPYPNNNCFFCGKDNPAGLKLEFYWDNESKEISAEYLPPQSFAGQGDILHGGIQMGLLDEIMGWNSFMHTKEMAVTSNLNIEFIKPVYLGTKINILCKVISREGSKVHMNASLFNAGGEKCTTAAGVFSILLKEKYNNLINTKTK